ncbi:AAA family ATPase [Priestia megaterium]|uniref:AAA family ATPase n=1 Tax=Priestia megaterium TaxID=1404 RepID=A0ABD4X353_PRIMG|nr:AAA family ATPase [Priestia megaterium]MDD9786684.1 AAA family ATPase [Priestia megaterium]
MIFIRRGSEPEKSFELLQEMQRLNEYLAHLRKVDGDDNYNLYTRRFQYKSLKKIDSIWYEELLKRFNYKCAYCETSVFHEDDVVNHFRPINGIKDDYTLKDHYLWLAYEWSNYYVTCSRCEGHKRNFFPIRRRYADFGGSVKYEKPLLVDPCSDNPEEHLIVEFTGRFFPKTEEGSTTIKLLNLNDEFLIRSRYKAMKNLLASVENFISQDYTNKNFSEIIKEEFDPKAEYILAKKYCLSRWIKNLNNQERRLILLDKANKQALESFVYKGFTTQKELIDLINTFLDTSNNVFDTTLDISHERKLVESIELVNIRGISFKYNFNLNDKGGPWLLLLGENGTGKSTILQSIALALSDNWTNLKVHPNSFVPEGEEGIIRVKTLDSLDPFEIIIRDNDIEYYSGHTSIPIIAYGSTRLLPKSSKRCRKVNDNIINLFPRNNRDYFLNHPTKGIKDRYLMEAIATAILDILPIGEKEIIDLIIEPKGMFVVQNNNTIPLNQLSSGYQNIIGITADIMRFLFDNSSVGHMAEGVVLIDELDAHLHPKWRLKIVDSLRKAFPNIQFIVTSHDPLTLRGINSKEVVVLKRDKQEISVMKNLPDAKGLMIDQILTSEFFELNTTLNTDVDNLIQRYYELLNEEDMSNYEKEELEKIENALRKPEIQYLGYTYREQLLYKVLDQFIAKRKAENNSFNELDPQTKGELFEIWGIDGDEKE